MAADDVSDPLHVVGQLAAALTEGYGVSNLVVTGSTALGVWAAPRQGLRSRRRTYFAPSGQWMTTRS